MTKTLSERLVEEWFDHHSIKWRPIRQARIAGNKRPDYSICIAGKWCIIEVKEISPNEDDKRIVEDARAGIVKATWVAPGERLRRPIAKANRQLRRFSARNLPTIICLFDATASFHDQDFHVCAAMYGDETLRFGVPAGSDTAVFGGSGPGRNAMLRRSERTTVSAVAVLRQPAGSGVVIDLYHNPFAAIPINPAIAAPYVRRQVAGASDSAKPEGSTWFDVRDDPAYQEFFDDPDAAMERVVREILGEQSK